MAGARAGLEAVAAVAPKLSRVAWLKANSPLSTILS